MLDKHLRKNYTEKQIVEKFANIFVDSVEQLQLACHACDKSFGRSGGKTLENCFFPSRNGSR